MATRTELESMITRCLRQLGGFDKRHTGASLKKMKKPELEAYADKTLTRLMIKQDIEDARYRDHTIGIKSERCFEAIVTAAHRAEQADTPGTGLLGHR
jgi:hypothetical protein